MPDSAPASTSAASPSLLLTFLQQPWVGQCAVLIVTFATGMATLAITQYIRASATPTEVVKSGLQAADKLVAQLPPTSACDLSKLEGAAAFLANRQGVIATDLAELKALALDRFPPAPKRAPSKVKTGSVQ